MLVDHFFIRYGILGQIFIPLITFAVQPNHAVTVQQRKSRTSLFACFELFIGQVASKVEISSFGIVEKDASAIDKPFQYELCSENRNKILVSLTSGLEQSHIMFPISSTKNGQLKRTLQYWLF
ncbi:MAG: hypothetical protein EZS28_056093, partial [Streblomastix strix]